MTVFAKCVSSCKEKRSAKEFAPSLGLSSSCSAAVRRAGHDHGSAVRARRSLGDGVPVAARGGARPRPTPAPDVADRASLIGSCLRDRLASPGLAMGGVRARCHRRRAARLPGSPSAAPVGRAAWPLVARHPQQASDYRRGTLPGAHRSAGLVLPARPASTSVHALVGIDGSRQTTRSTQTGTGGRERRRRCGRHGARSSSTPQ
eukprot:COSAG06_NODE_465_length_15359_cov_6.047706_2_plen_204_part_00